MNSLVYRTLFYVNIYGSYKLKKTVRFLAHPVYGDCSVAGGQNFSQSEDYLNGSGILMAGQIFFDKIKFSSRKILQGTDILYDLYVNLQVDPRDRD